MNRFMNRKVKAFPGFVITDSNDYHLAKTAIKTAIRSKVPEVRLTEMNQGVVSKFAYVEKVNQL